MFDGEDTSWAAATFSGVRGCLIYNNTLGTKNCLVLVNFAADYGVTSGTFSIQWAPTGIFTIDLTP